MADETNEQLCIAPFPAPPPFWKHFSTTNLTRLETLKNDAATALDPKSLPLPLRYLLPPPNPTSSTYPTFHLTHPTNPASTHSATSNIPTEDLANLLITPTASTPIPAALKSLTSSLLLTFLQLTQLLSLDPTHESRYELLEHVKEVFVNIHVLINSYRPHQAREGVVNMLRDRIEEARGEMRQSRELRERVEEFLGGLEGKGNRSVNGDGEAGPVARRGEERNKLMWRMIREIGKEEEVVVVVEDG